MRILMITFRIPYPEALSGAAVVMHGQLSALSARHEITIAAFAVDDAVEKKALDELRASGVKVHLVREAWPMGVIRWKRNCERMLNRFRGKPPWGNLNFTDSKMQDLLDRLLGRQRFDVVQVENIGMGHYQYEADIPSVLTEHEVGRSLPGDDEGRQQYQPKIWRQFDRIQVFTQRDATAIRTVAPEIGDRVEVNPFGVNIPQEVDYEREEPGTVIFVGGFNHPPNVDAAMWLGNEIMPLLRRQWPGIHLKIVGAFPPRAVRALAKDDIIVTGRVPAIEPYLEQAAVVLSPIRIGGGMRVKVLQAMAMGKAVVTTPLGAEGLAGTRDLLPLAIGETAEEIADATAALLTSSDDRRELGCRARAFVRKHHSWSAYGQRLEATYAKLLQGYERAWGPISV